MANMKLKTILIPTAAAILVGFGSVSLWAQSTDEEPRRLAMMHMDEMGKMKPMEKKPGMAGMPDNRMKGRMPMPADAPMPGAASGAQDPMATPSSMDMMGRMRAPMQARQGMKSMTPNASLPGFPGASHLYHVGATGFFLDYPQLVSLSTAQQTTLNRIKEKSALEQASFSRRIEEAEQELWTLTSADAPDAAKIEAKVRAIEALRGDQRLAFIRAVGEAGKVLTSDQQAVLLGNQPMTRMTPAPAAAPATPAAPMPPMKMN